LKRKKEKRKKGKGKDEGTYTGLASGLLGVFANVFLASHFG